MNSHNSQVTLSTITPVYCGADYLQKLVNEIAIVREQWIRQESPVFLSEAIFIDDNSIDSSSSILQKLQKQYEWVKVITLSRNFGQHSATVAGICHSSSDWVVTLDEDLQHQPDQIELLLKTAIYESMDVVYAKPKEAAHGNSWRDLSSRLVKRLLARMTSTPEIKMFNSYRLIRGSIARAAASSSSSQTYLDIAISWFTKSTVSKKIDMQDDRYQNQKKSGYGLMKLIKHARFLFVSAEIDIASAGLMLGTSAILISILIGSTVILQKLFFPEVIASTGWASLMAVTTFVGGISIAILCVALEYISIILLNQLGKPTFFSIDRSKDIILKHWFEKK